MSEARGDLRDRVLDAFLGLIADRGYGEVSLRDVGEAAGLGLAELYRLYPDKLALVQAFMARIDGEVLAGTPASLDAEETVRDRLFDLLMRRYDALQPHRPALTAIRRAGLRDPLMALVLGPALMRSMAAMLEAAGVPARGVLRCGAAERTGGDLCRGLAGVRQGRFCRPLEDHGGARQPSEDGRKMGSNL